jgi:glycosyltransferase involved in cell wall biosynthesis
MKYVFTSYVLSPDFTKPEDWLKRVNAYGGILEALAKTDIVISLEQINYEGELRKNMVQYYFLKFTDRERKHPTKLHEFIKSEDPDIVVVQGVGFSLQLWLLRRALKGTKARIIAQHRADHPPKNFLKKQIAKLADKGIKAYLFTSKAMGQEWVDAGIIRDANKIHELMPVSSVFKQIDRGCARSKTGVEGSPSFLWVGLLDGRKDPLTAVKAFLKYLPSQPGAHLYMVHQTNDLLPAIQQLLAGQPTFKDNITMVGKVPHDDLLYWYNSVDFVIASSHYESGGAAVCEAMSCGCIPILTNIDSFKMITGNGKCGMLYPAGNEHALLDTLNQIGQKDITQMREETLAHYTSALSFDTIASRLRGITAGLAR